MRASRLVELLLRLQLQGGAPARELADAFEVSIRTIYRDVEALCAAGIPIYAEVGRNGGIRIDPSYRVAGMPRLDPDEARGLLFAVVPAIAAQLGIDAAVADRTLLPALDAPAEAAARVVRDRVLVEPSHWFVAPDDVPVLAAIARAVWESWESRLIYRGTDVVVRPLGLILKGDTWYVIGLARRGRSFVQRLFRLSRVESIELLPHHFERPPGFDLTASWADHREAFLASLPSYVVRVRVAPSAVPMLGILDEGAPPLPLPDDVERDEDGWVTLQLCFERTAGGAARQLLQLGGEIEVLDPPELRDTMAREAARLAQIYRRF